MNTVDIEMVPHHRSVAVLFSLKYTPLSISGVHIHPVYARGIAREKQGGRVGKNLQQGTCPSVVDQDQGTTTTLL